MLNYYQLLKEKFPSKSAVMTEMINLEAICHLPKGTEFFLSDLHGEYQAFDYLMRSGSGSIRKKVMECFLQLSQAQLDTLCQYIYYPEEKIALRKQETSNWQAELTDYLPYVIRMAKYAGSKYTRSKVRKQLPADYAYIMEELLNEENPDINKQGYYQAIIAKVCELGQLPALFSAFATLIQTLSIDHLHVVGDIYDRGAFPDLIIDRLQEFSKIDIQWGNHDITWIGAMSGSYICMINVIRIAARYNSLALLEDRYGINLRGLIDYSQQHFTAEPVFDPILDGVAITEEKRVMLNKLQQAAAFLQFKLEHQLVARRPEFEMDAALLFDQIDRQKQTVTIGGKVYSLTAFPFDQLNWTTPAQLTKNEQLLLEHLLLCFQSSLRLKEHIAFLMDKGAIYHVSNNHLLYHGCIPMEENGAFKTIHLAGQALSGKALLDFFERRVRAAYDQPHQHTDFNTDLFWYLWCGPGSSLFGKNRMTTFERYYIQDKVSHKEIKNAYYQLRSQKSVCLHILRQFGLNETAHIVNGHTPVKEKKGEKPIRAEGKMLIIDGGLAKGYQQKTGIAGYTLISNSYGLEIVAHKPFISVDAVLAGQGDIIFIKRLIEEVPNRTLVKETDNGKELQAQIEELSYLYYHYDQF
ncbi:fructose-1,6-bisphosphatase [Streptococcus halichoeri]|uniref:fructose-1,6-bisphosphatase n=1 Tax=Streptococcus halichoeri TaxID=254785 RepID=UPI00135C3C64|nr:fructose-1,6-bisphosphatase [Streptococcus halichoeri]